MKFNYYRPHLKIKQCNRAITIGAFDGLHLGHQKLLLRNAEIAQENDFVRTLITFEPSPAEYFQLPSREKVMSLREKLYFLRETELLDEVFILPFNQYWAKLTADQFLEEILVEQLQMKSIVVGEDFRFGYRAQGDFAYLKHRADELGYQVHEEPFYYLNRERVSSTLIRQALKISDFERVADYLGRPYEMGGRVIYGNQLARQLGTPTINIAIGRESLPLQGVFNVKAIDCATGKEYLGVANVGLRPTVNKTQPSLEVHLHDTNENLYHHYFRVIFLSKIREEQKFSGLEALKTQIAKDIERSKEYFKHHIS